MDLNNIGKFLQKAVPIDNSSLNDILAEDLPLGVIRGEDGRLVLPTVMPIIPIAFISRNRSRIDLCGCVEEGTEEYTRGLRYFSSTGDFFYQNGQYFQTKESPEDIVDVYVSSQIKEKPYFSKKWVHPQYVLCTSFFSKFIPYKTGLRKDDHYLNRMGFVVTIVDEIEENGLTLFVDENEFQYRPDGCLSDSQSSMFDLTHKILNWEAFSKSEWSSDNLESVDLKDNYVPQLFNPFESTHDLLLNELCRLVTRAHEIGEQVDYQISFNFESKKFRSL